MMRFLLRLLSISAIASAVEGEDPSPPAISVSSGDNGITASTTASLFATPVSVPDNSAVEQAAAVDPPEDDIMYSTLHELFQPIWLSTSDGWSGGSYGDAIEYCNSIRGKQLCPYAVMCPLGPGGMVMGGRHDVHLNFTVEGEQYAPVLGGINNWVMIGSQDMIMDGDNMMDSDTMDGDGMMNVDNNMMMNEGGGNNKKCMTHVQLEGKAPEWGLNGDRAELKQHIMCCTDGSNPVSSLEVEEPNVTEGIINNMPCSKVCLNGGRCLPANESDDGMESCSCSEAIVFGKPYAGLTCEYPATKSCMMLGSESKHSFCTNHGVCEGWVSDDEEHKGCICSPGFEGSHCEFPAPVVSQPNTWEYLPVKMPTPLSDMANSLLSEDSSKKRIVITGGCDSPEGNELMDEGYFVCSSHSSKMYAFDPIRNLFQGWNGDFEELADMPRPRIRHSSTYVNGVLCVFGGRDIDDILIAEVDCYDPDTNTWSTPFSLPDEYQTSDFAAHTIEHNKVYLIGGYDAVYTARDQVTIIDMSDMANPSYSAGPNLIEKRGDIAAAYVAGDVYVSGGFTHENDFAIPKTSVERYDAVTQTWQSVNPLNGERGNHQLVPANGNIFALGGETNVEHLHALELPSSEILDSVEVLDLVSDISGTLEDTAEALGLVSDIGVTLEFPTSEIFAVMEDLASDIGDIQANGGTQARWRNLSTMPTKLFRFVASAWEGLDENDGEFIFVFGGETSYSKDCKCFRNSDNVMVFDTSGAGHEPVAVALPEAITTSGATDPATTSTIESVTPSQDTEMSTSTTSNAYTEIDKNPDTTTVATISTEGATAKATNVAHSISPSNEGNNTETTSTLATTSTLTSTSTMTTAALVRGIATKATTIPDDTADSFDELIHGSDAYKYSVRNIGYGIEVLLFAVIFFPM